MDKMKSDQEIDLKIFRKETADQFDKKLKTFVKTQNRDRKKREGLWWSFRSLLIIIKKILHMHDNSQQFIS